jgi:hypothetical protein
VGFGLREIWGREADFSTAAAEVPPPSVEMTGFGLGLVLGWEAVALKERDAFCDESAKG